MRLDLATIQIEAVAAMLRDELGDDERAYLDSLEGETDLYEWIHRLLVVIEENEGIEAALAEQISDRTLRKSRAAKRIETARSAISALLECAQLDKLSLPEATVSVRRNAPPTKVTDEAAVPDELCRFTRKPDMSLIKAEMEAGRAVFGVTVGNAAPILTVRRK